MEFTSREASSIQTRLESMSMPPRIVPSYLRGEPRTIIRIDNTFLSHSQIAYLLDLCTRYRLELFYSAPDEGKAYHGLTKLDTDVGR